MTKLIVLGILLENLVIWTSKLIGGEPAVSDDLLQEAQAEPWWDRDMCLEDSQGGILCDEIVDRQ